MECGKWFDRWLDKAVSTGQVTMAQVDTALTNLFSVLMRLGRFNKSKGPYDDISLSEVHTDFYQTVYIDYTY